MKCIKCTTKNITNANYCKNCGNKFLEVEKKAAKKWTLVWFLECIDKIKSLWKFKFITDSKGYKVISVILVLGVGIYSLLVNGNNLKILESDDYQIQYNTRLSEYYLLINTDKTQLNLYVPNKSNKLTVEHLNKNNELLEEKNYNDDENIILESNTIYEDYYIIKTNYDKKESDSLKVFIYREETK